MTAAGQRPPAPTDSGPFGLPTAWWPVAFAEEVTQRPGRFVLGSRALALYRDRAGCVRAVDDVCPHRRMRLSLGRVTEDGYLQCAYHGWSFDGATGRCTAIPNLRGDEEIKGNLKVAAFATAENVAGALKRPGLAGSVSPPTGEETSGLGTTLFDARLDDGMVMVWSGARPVADAGPGTSACVEPARALRGKVDVRTPYWLMAQALLWNPGKALSLRGLLGAGDEVVGARARVAQDTITVTRERLTLDLPRPHTFAPINRATTAVEVIMNVISGVTSMQVCTGDGRRVARVSVGLTPIGLYKTTVRWRAEIDQGLPAVLRRLACSLATPGRTAETAARMADEAAERADAALVLFQQSQRALCGSATGSQCKEHADVVG